MSAAEIAGRFAEAFFERLVANPASLSEMYGELSSFNAVDMERGQAVAHGQDIPAALKQWTEIVEDSDIVLDSVTADFIHHGVSTFMAWTATSTVQQQFFHMTTVLEEYDVDSFYVRHQTIIRQASIPIVQPEPVVVEVPAPVPEVAEPVAVETPTPAVVEPAIEEPKRKSKKAAKSAKVEEAPTATAEVAAEAATPVAEVTEAAPAPAPAAEVKAPAPSRPKSWASVAGTGPSESSVPHKTYTVTTTVKKQDPTPTEKTIAEKAPARSAPREPRATVGDRLMFRIPHPVTESEIRAAMGSISDALVSLRNKSDTGMVFMDFKSGVNVMDELRDATLVIGEKKTKVIVFRQREVTRAATASAAVATA